MQERRWNVRIKIHCILFGGQGLPLYKQNLLQKYLNMLVNQSIYHKLNTLANK